MSTGLAAPAAEDSEGSAAAGVHDVRELEEQTELGEIYLSAIIRRQLRLSVVTVVVFVAILCAQPIISTIWPAYGDVRVFGIPLAWLVLGVGSYPLMYLLALNYTRRAETIDDEFTKLLR